METLLKRKLLKTQLEFFGPQIGLGSCFRDDPRKKCRRTRSDDWVQHVYLVLFLTLFEMSFSCRLAVAEGVWRTKRERFCEKKRKQNVVLDNRQRFI